MKKQCKFIYIIITIIIIVGVIIGATQGFKMDFNYSSRQMIIISAEKKLDKKEIEDIAKSVLENKKIEIYELDRLSKKIEILSEDITEEERNNIVTKVNEKYELSLSNENVEIQSIHNTRIKDILKPYILPAVISFVMVLLYFTFLYHTLGLGKILLKSILIPIMAELLLYSIILIFRLPFGRIVNSIAVGVYILSVFILTCKFQKDKNNMKKKENDK